MTAQRTPGEILFEQYLPTVGITEFSFEKNLSRER